MSGMVERVAKAIYEKRNGFGCDPWRSRPKAYKEPYLHDARAAIEAMREPEVEMLAAFWRQKTCGTQEPGEIGDACSDYDAWRAALTAALALPIPGGENTEGEKR